MIIAKTVSVDKNGESIDYILPLRHAPFAGDVIFLLDGTALMVVRRQFYELDPNGNPDSPDMRLEVRRVSHER